MVDIHQLAQALIHTLPREAIEILIAAIDEHPKEFVHVLVDLYLVHYPEIVF